MNDSKKLVYILPVYTKQTDTHHRHLYQMIEELATKFEIFVIVEQGEQVELNGIQGSVCLPRFKIGRFMALSFWLAKLRLQGYRKCYIHYSYIGVLVAKLFRYKTWYWNCGQMWLFGGIQNRWFLKLILRLSDTLVTGTSFMAQGYIDHYGLSSSQVAVVPNWIDMSDWKETDEGAQERLRKKLSIPEEDFVVLFVHRLAPRKGSRYLPKIWEQIKNREDVHLVIAGNGPDRIWLEQEMERSDRKERVHLVGPVPNTEIPVYMGISNVFIMPSEEEGFPRVSIEAMAAGLPLVAFDTGGLEEIFPVELQKYIFPIGDVRSFVSGVTALLEETRDWKDLLQQHVKKFDIQSVSKKFINLMQ